MTDKIIPDLEKSTIAINPISIIADGKTEAVIKIQLKKSNGHNIKENIGGIAIIRDETVLGKLGDIVFDPEGFYTATLSSGVIGEENFCFSVDGVKHPASAKVSYTDAQEQKTQEPKIVIMLNPDQNAEPKEASVHPDMVKTWELEGWKVK